VNINTKRLTRLAAMPVLAAGILAGNTLTVAAAAQASPPPITEWTWQVLNSTDAPITLSGYQGAEVDGSASLRPGQTIAPYHTAKISKFTSDETDALFIGGNGATYEVGVKAFTDYGPAAMLDIRCSSVGGKCIPDTGDWIANTTHVGLG